MANYVTMQVDLEYFALLEAIANESREVKHLLRSLGYGVSGMNLMLTVREVLEELEIREFPCG